MQKRKRKKLKKLISSLYNITDDDILESYARDSMEFDVENRDIDDEYVKPYDVEYFSDNTLETRSFESLLTSDFVEKNEHAVNNDFEARFQYDFGRSEELRLLGFESELMNNHNRYIEEYGYDAFVEKQREIYYARYERMVDSNSKNFEDKMHNLDEDLIKNNNSELKL